MLLEDTEFARCENCKSINKVPIEHNNEKLMHNAQNENEDIHNKVSYMVNKSNIKKFIK